MPRLIDDVTWQEIDGELVVLDLARSVYLTTNRSGAFLTKLLVVERGREDLVDALVGEYAIDTMQAARDVDAFLDQLAQKRLLA